MRYSLLGNLTSDQKHKIVNQKSATRNQQLETPYSVRAE